MLDIKLIRENTDKVKQGVQKKGADASLVDGVLEWDEKRRASLVEIEGLRAKQNKFGKDRIKEAQEIKQKIKLLEPELEKAEVQFNRLMRLLPNLPQDSVPEGKDETGNVVLREEGRKTKFSFPAKDYLALTEKLDLVDVKRAAKVVGTRFGYLKKEAALLEFALVNFAFDTLVKAGFTPVVPPVMIKPEMASGMGYLEQIGDEEAYFIEKDKLYLVGTSEQTVGTMHAGETFQEKDLPQRYVAFSTCFRREAGSYGKDTKGIFRVHQFDKVEMFSFCRPGDSDKEHKLLLSLEEKMMKGLELPYRVVNICSGDLGVPAASKYDIEAWLPGQGEYRETHSTSNCTDFQSRRLNIRYRSKNGFEFVHTLNGTAFAVGRMLIAIIENYQQKDGSVEVPKALQKYVSFKKIKAGK